MKEDKNIVISELHTLRDFLRWATSQFYAADLYFGHGTDNAWDEAVALALYVLHLPPDVNLQVMDARLTTQEKTELLHLIMRRVNERIPAAYLTHQAWFAGLTFYVDAHVLIPRSPVAELIEQQFTPWIAPEQVTRILDLCTGSGCIAIACAKFFPEALVDAVDISVEALAVAEKNIIKHRVNEQVTVMQSDLFANLAAGPYNIIISNPPYVSAEEMASLPVEYHHEPALGLAAGQDGLLVVLQILQEASKHLTQDGILIVEVGNSEEALIAQFPHVPFTWLTFERGGGGVFLLTAAQLKQYF